MIVKEVILTLAISSPAFSHKGLIPPKYTCDGTNVNPPLTIGDIPENTKSLVLTVDDPDAPAGIWDHWIVWNITPREEIEENSVPGKEGMNSFLQHHYGGPCPPSGTHRYFFKVYALDTMLQLDADSDKRMVEKSMSGHILAKGELIGLYKRKS